MGLILSNSDRRIIFAGGARGGDASLVNEKGADFLVGTVMRQFRTGGTFPTVYYRDSGLYWEESERNQRCVFQFRIVDSKNLKAHFAYLGREGTDREGENPSGFFNHSSYDLSQEFIEYTDPSQIDTQLFRTRSSFPQVTQEIEQAKKENRHVQKISYMEAFKAAPDDEKSFRFMISPEFAGKVPLPEFTREVMEKMEKEIGTRLAWVATTHYDTGHPHIHIVVRGQNEYLQPLFIHKDVLYNAMRVWSREILTTYQGERTDVDIVSAYNKDATAERYTKLDVMLEKNAAGNTHGKVVFSLFYGKENVGKDVLAALDRRLKFLSGIGMATKDEKNVWTLASDLKENLRDKQIQKDIVRSIERNKSIMKSTQKIFTLDTPTVERAGGIFGRVVSRQFVSTDDIGESVDIFVEDSAGRIFIHRLTQKHETRLPGLNPGNFCAISAPVQYNEIDNIVAKEITNSPANDNGTITISVNDAFLKKNSLEKDRLYVVRKRIQQYVEFGLCAITDSDRDSLTVQFENDAIVKIQALQKKRGKKHTIVPEGGANKKDFDKQIENVGLTTIDRYLMHQCNLSKDFILVENEVVHTPSLQADDSAFSRWYLDLTQAVCRRIEFHIRNKRIWVAETSDGGKQELRYDKNFTDTLWEERAEFARIIFQTDTGIKVGVLRNPAPGEKIEGTIRVSEKFGIAFVDEKGTCVALPAVSSIRRHNNEVVRFSYPELFSRNKQARDFYLTFEQIVQSQDLQEGGRDGK